MTTEIILHYRPYENDPTQLSKIAEKVIQDFPTRPQSRFIPWFPYDGSRLPVKPKRSLPAFQRGRERCETVLDRFRTRGEIPELRLRSRSVGVSASSEKAAVDAVALVGSAGSPCTAAEAIRERKKKNTRGDPGVSPLPTVIVPERFYLCSKTLQDTLKTLTSHSLSDGK